MTLFGHDGLSMLFVCKSNEFRCFLQTLTSKFGKFGDFFVCLAKSGYICHDFLGDSQSPRIAGMRLYSGGFEKHRRQMSMRKTHSMDYLPIEYKNNFDNYETRIYAQERHTVITE